MKKIFTSFHIVVGVVLFYIILAIFAPILANDKPVICLSDKHCLQPLIPYSPTTTHLDDGILLSPFESQPVESLLNRHWLGTDKLGRDVASGMIHGARVSVMIGFISVIFIFFLGTFLGMSSAYSLQKNITFNFFQIATISITATLSAFYLIYETKFSNQPVISTLVILLLTICLITLWVYLGNRWKKLNRYKLPLDLIMIKVIEARKSFPGIFLFLSLAGIFTFPSVWNIIFIITILGWTEFARHARAETMAVLDANYITSVRLLGISRFRILLRHVLPNILPTLLVIACFSVAGSILIESSLSFLGIGLPIETVTWGKMMADGRNMQNWWLVVIPGFAIFSIILSLNIIANHLLQKQKKK